MHNNNALTLDLTSESNVMPILELSRNCGLPLLLFLFLFLFLFLLLLNYPWSLFRCPRFTRTLREIKTCSDNLCDLHTPSGKFPIFPLNYRTLVRKILRPNNACPSSNCVLPGAECRLTRRRRRSIGSINIRCPWQPAAPSRRL